MSNSRTSEHSNTMQACFNCETLGEKGTNYTPRPQDVECHADLHNIRPSYHCLTSQGLNQNMKLQ